MAGLVPAIHVFRHPSLLGGRRISKKKKTRLASAARNRSLEQTAFREAGRVKPDCCLALTGLTGESGDVGCDDGDKGTCRNQT